MRAHMLAVVVAATLVMCAGLGWAQGWDALDIWNADDAANAPLTSWFGTSGLVVVPTAQTLPPQGLQAHINVIETENDDWATIWGANVSLYEGLEGGVTGLDDTWTGTDSEVLFQAKWRLPVQDYFGLPAEAPMIAVGGRDLGDRINRAWYVVLTKDVPLDATRQHLIGLTVGFGDTEVSDTPLDGLFGGVDVPLFDYARLQLEHDGENFNAALRYWWSEWAVTEFALLDDNMGFGFTVDSGF